MISKIIISLLMLPLAICCSGFSRKEQNSLIHQVVNSFCEEWGKIGFSCFGSGGGMMYEIQTVDLSFIKEGSVLSIAESREILVEMIDDLTHRINSCRNLRPYLAVYPFPVKGCIISILSEDNCRKETAIASGLYGSMVYTFGRPKERLEESYEEAKRIVIAAKKRALMGSVKDDI